MTIPPPSKANDVNVSTREELWASIEKFCSWLADYGSTSYDPYDIWGTRYGCWARRLYYDKHPLGVVMTAPLILAEMICPGIRALFVDKNRFPTADAQLALAFLNLSGAHLGVRDNTSIQGTPVSYLMRAKDLAAGLLGQSVSGYSGYCWGYPFDWQNVRGFVPKDTPHITATPYCYEVFTQLFDLTGEQQYLDVALSIAGFFSDDLNDTPTGKDSAAGSYTPIDHSKVINASAYRAFVLFDAARRFGNETWRTKAGKNLRFILQNQKPDGSWLYAIDDPHDTFIDNFHTCFVLKNLYKLNRHVQSDDVDRAIRDGYRFYRTALIDEQDNPRLFVRAPRTEIVRLEMYCFAEAITLGALLRDDIPEAFQLAERLAKKLIRHHQLADGHWVTRVYIGGISHTVPFLRWPQSQLFYALTNLLVALEQ